MNKYVCTYKYILYFQYAYTEIKATRGYYICGGSSRAFGCGFAILTASAFAVYV